jgi:hypothetical protein
MFINLSKYIAVLTHFKINANQFLLCYLLYVDEKENGSFNKNAKPIANLWKYTTQAVPWKKTEINDLVEKGLLKDANDHQTSNPDLLEVTDKFKTHVFIHADAFDQLFEAYPTLIDNFNNPNGPKIKLKVCKIGELKKLYLSKVKSKTKHKHIMSLIEWAKENDEINFNFDNFIRGELWRTLQEIKDGGTTTIQSNMHAAE